MNKNRIMNIMNWVMGMLLCPLGIAFYTKANFGLSMVAAPAYIIHIKLKEMFSWYTQGTSEYIFQTILIIILSAVIKRFNKKYLLSFFIAVLSGFIIDGWLFVLGGNMPYESMAMRIFAFIIGELALAIAIAFFFRTDMPVQIYELAVNEISDKWGFNKNRVKLIHDISMLVLSIILAIVLNQNFKGLGIGTIIITLVNAPLIKFFGEIIDRTFGKRKEDLNG